MRKPMRSSMEDLIAENKQELLRDPSAINEIEKKLDEKKAKEVYVETQDETKRVQ
ncbi:FbpB family small basic protein [Salibacterium lacus]|uniref:FbpB family small basic protein n=1 Tax=Salibacterium lacus TaxID=1898109 RepID=A0ABW5SWR7_9BACI